MTDNADLREMYRLHQDSQSKYVYFLLAVSGAALGYGLQRLEGISYSWWVSPGLLSLGFWLASFYCGCKRITWVHSAIYANYSLLQLGRGVHPEQPSYPREVGFAMEGTRSAVGKNTANASKYTKLQFRFLAIGVVLFVIWRLVEMARLTFVA